MDNRLNKPGISVNPRCFILLAFALLLLPFRWIIAWVAASAFHEFCHYIALRLSGCRVLRVMIGPGGAVMDTDLTGDAKEIICALAGPFGSLLLLLIGRHCPRSALCALFQSVYNLIPIYPLDGGRALRGVLRKVFPDNGEIIGKWIEYCATAALLILCAYAALVLGLGILPLLLAVGLILKNRHRKFACKESILGVE